MPDMTLFGVCGRTQDAPGFSPRQVTSMVAHRQRLDDMGKGRPGLHDKYWRRGMAEKHTKDDLKDFLNKRGFYHKKSEKLSRLEVLAERCDRGHLSYEGYDVAQLRQFVKHRGLKMASPSKANKKQLVQHLEDADGLNDKFEDSREFPRFLELPPELRNAVYTFYFNALGVIPQRFSQPPLCKVSRELRAESLGLFYEHSTFSISMTRCLLTTGDVAINHQSKLFRDSILLPDFTRIKHLSIELEVGSFFSAVGTWTIDLTSGMSTANSSCRRRQEMQQVVDDVMAREGPNKLRKSDIETFRLKWAERCFSCGSGSTCVRSSPI
jgi:hypothetical protein